MPPFCPQVVGSQARILYSDQKGRVAIAVAFNQAIAQGKIKVTFPVLLVGPPFGSSLSAGTGPCSVYVLVEGQRAGAGSDDLSSHPGSDPGPCVTVGKSSARSEPVSLL